VVDREDDIQVRLKELQEDEKNKPEVL